MGKLTIAEIRFQRAVHLLIMLICIIGVICTLKLTDHATKKISNENQYNKSIEK